MKYCLKYVGASRNGSSPSKPRRFLKELAKIGQVISVSKLIKTKPETLNYTKDFVTNPKEPPLAILNLF